MAQKQYTTKPLRPKMFRKDLFPLIEKENLFDKKNYQDLQIPIQNTQKKLNFYLYDPLDNIPLSKLEIGKNLSTEHREINT